MSSFYQYEEAIEQFVLFAEFIQPQLIKQGSESELMKAISKVKLIKANDEIYEYKYTDDGAIFDMMAHSVLVYGLSKSSY